MAQVRQSVQALQPLLVLTDGWAVYPNSIRGAFREKVLPRLGTRRTLLQIWSKLHIGTPIKRTEKKRIVEITREVVYGLIARAEVPLRGSRGGLDLNTAFIERLDGPFRERLASLTCRSRHATRRLWALNIGMYLLGCSYNFCFLHHELSKATHAEPPCTPAMAVELADYGLEHLRTLELPHCPFTLG